MRLAPSYVMATALVLGDYSPLLAQQPPSYAKHVKPFLTHYCVECHNGKEAEKELNLETYQGLLKGSENGPVLVPGKPDDSRVVLMVEGKKKPSMPPKKARQPKPEEVAVLRAWVAAGAKDDPALAAVAIPNIQPRVPSQAPIAALAYRPDGKLLVAGGYNEVALIEPATGEVTGKLTGQTSKVTALTFSRDGQRLAVASGAAGKVGEVRLYALAAGSTMPTTPDQLLGAHQDMILDLAFSPDGKLLATCGYDRLIKLWDVAGAKELRILKDHSDAVYSLAFSPNGRLLASAAADRAVKVWDVATGKRLYTLSEATDWLYAVAWSPDGRSLAAGGVDKSIRLWEVSAAGGKILHSVFAHEGPVSRLVYATDGKTLYSLSEDRTAKAWDTSRMVERKVYPKQPELALAFALRPDQKQLAFGRYDGTALLLDAATGQVQLEPLPVKPKPPQLVKLTPSTGQRGQKIRVTFEGKHLESITDVASGNAGVTAKIIEGEKKATTVQVDLTFPVLAPAGSYKLGLKSPLGDTTQLPFAVDLFSSVAEMEPNDSPLLGQRITLPMTVVGKMDKAGDIDFYRFEAKAGQQLGVQAVTGAIGSKLDPVLTLTDASGQIVAEGRNGVLGHVCVKAGVYALGIHDHDFRGGGEMHYRLQIGEVPVITTVFPLGLQRGTETDVRVEGVNLGPISSIHVKAPTGASTATSVPLPVSTPTGAPLGTSSVVVGEFPEVLQAGTTTVPVPGTANGRIEHPGATHTWRFGAKKGQRLILEVNARRIGSPLDSYLEILDLQGQPVARATLRSLAKTYTTFRDHDAVGTGIRMETWNELAINDYLYVGSELIRIEALPKNPDDDCQFFSTGGQRLGFLDTTPTYHPLGEPMYKIAIHPPGTTFSPNGFPVISLPYRNDDGGPGYGKDSRLFFDPPADGEFLVRIGDSRGQGGNAYAYRLTVRPPRPSFNISFSPTAPAVWKGGAIPVNVSADRMDGYQGAIDVRLENLPPGFSAPATSIPAGENSTTFALWAEPTAAVVKEVPPLKLVACAAINGEQVVREVTGGVPRVVDPGDLTTITDQPEVTVKPGQEVRLTARIERRNGFKGRVPVEVRGLPHGVRVLDIGLNGILITEKEESRTFVIYAEPWVEPTAHPFVVLAKQEGKSKEHAAKSVLLKIIR